MSATSTHSNDAVSVNPFGISPLEIAAGALRFSASYVRQVGNPVIEVDPSVYFATEEVAVRGKHRVDGDLVDLSVNTSLVMNVPLGSDGRSTINRFVWLLPTVSGSSQTSPHKRARHS